MITVLLSTVAGFAAGMRVAATHPDEPDRDRLAVVLVLTFAGFVIGVLVVLVVELLSKGRVLL